MRTDHALMHDAMHRSRLKDWAVAEQDDAGFTVASKDEYLVVADAPAVADGPPYIVALNLSGDEPPIVSRHDMSSVIDLFATLA